MRRHVHVSRETTAAAARGTKNKTKPNKTKQREDRFGEHCLRKRERERKRERATDGKTNIPPQRNRVEAIERVTAEEGGREGQRKEKAPPFVAHRRH